MLCEPPLKLGLTATSALLIVPFPYPLSDEATPVTLTINLISVLHFPNHYAHAFPDLPDFPFPPFA